MLFRHPPGARERRRLGGSRALSQQFARVVLRRADVRRTSKTKDRSLARPCLMFLPTCPRPPPRGRIGTMSNCPITNLTCANSMGRESLRTCPAWHPIMRRFGAAFRLSGRRPQRLGSAQGNRGLAAPIHSPRDAPHGEGLGEFFCGRGGERRHAQWCEA